jgi:hypothetical protein
MVSEEISGVKTRSTKSRTLFYNAIASGVKKPFTMTQKHTILRALVRN